MAEKAISGQDIDHQTQQCWESLQVEGRHEFQLMKQSIMHGGNVLDIRRYPKGLPMHSKTEMENIHIKVADRKVFKTYLATCNTGAKGIITDTNLFVNVSVREVIFTPSHCTDEHCDGVCGRKSR